ncbi:MAG: 4Fe-4S binding protein [Deltaproteobacteria bacterium]|nr:4Fe-4S binding protein [Deltaproteobacteria bacterium]
MKVNRKIIEIDEELCNGCGQCVPSCAEGALEIIEGKAKLVAEVYCDGLGACIGECPTGALTVTERKADEFDEEAVEVFLRSKDKETPAQEEAMACGCPSSQIRDFASTGACEDANQPIQQQSQNSALVHWPVHIKLVPPTAPFLKGADLLVAADCTPVAYPDFHRDFLKGKAVMVGCPKLDDAEEYVQKFADVFKVAEIKSVSVLVMEVPCCQGLPVIIRKGMEKAGKNIPMEKLVISTRGDLMSRYRLAA